VRKVDPVQHEEKRREILEAAARCFGRSGFQGASTASICSEASISPGHLYHYFASKEAIIEAIAAASLQRAAARFGEVASGTSVVDTFVAHLDWTINEQAARGTSMVFDIFAEACRNPTVAKIVNEHSRGMLGLLANLLRHGQARGEIDPTIDPEQVAPVLISILDGSKTLVLRNPHVHPDDHVKVLRNLTRRFLAMPTSPQPVPPQRGERNGRRRKEPN
jgi:TetR/AcrR family transcriptional regulator, repressor for uid operon